MIEAVLNPIGTDGLDPDSAHYKLLTVKTGIILEQISGNKQQGLKDCLTLLDEVILELFGDR